MSTSLRFLGVAGYEIVGPMGRILVDPFLSGNPVAPIGHEDLERPDVILITHAARDHLGDAAEIALRTGSPIVCGYDSSALLRERGVPDDQIRATIWGIEIEVGRIRVIPVEVSITGRGHRSPMDRSCRVGRSVSSCQWIPRSPCTTAGTARSSATCDSSANSTDPRQACSAAASRGLSCRATTLARAGSLTGEMTPEQAAIAADLLGVRYAIASHYVDPEDRDVADFIKLVREREFEQRADRTGPPRRRGDRPRAHRVTARQPLGPHDPSTRG